MPPQRTQQHGKAKFSQDTTTLVDLGDDRFGQGEIFWLSIGINLVGQAIGLHEHVQRLLFKVSSTCR